MRKIFTLFILLLSISSFAQTKHTISGTVGDSTNGEELIGASIYITNGNEGTITNVYGFYSLTLPDGTYSLSCSFMGYETNTQNITLDKDIKLDIELAPTSVEIGTAIIETEKAGEENIKSVEMSKVKLSMETIKKIPAFMGEVDVIKAIQLLPGVQTVGEGNSGFYVRGGAVDQNLILLDEAMVYNASHVMGFFSVFNSDVIKDVQLYKGGIPARYGGRLSSVLDIRMKEGNSKNFMATGGLGTVSSRLTLETPILKQRGSIVVAGRASYADQFLKFSKSTALKETKVHFYDLNLKANYKFSDNDRIYLSSYFGRDVMKFSDLFGMAWGNTTATLRWNHIYNSRLFSNLTVIYSDYDYSLGGDDGRSAFDWTSGITDVSAKLDYNYYMNPNNTISFGAIATRHEMNPGNISSSGDQEFNSLEISARNSMEYGVYASNEHSMTDWLTIQYGLRYSIFQNVGDGTQWSFDDEYNVVDSVYYSGKFKAYNTYHNPEPRIGMNIKLNSKSSVKASYNRTVQYIHLASNSVSSSPLDIWFPSSPVVKPQKADQYALGYFRNFENNNIETSVEVYYKDMHNSIDFKNHAILFLNKQIEGELRFGKARSYGLEFMMRRHEGKFTGLVSYTLARTERYIEDVSEDWYPTKYDKTHDISVLLMYNLSKKWSFGANWVYSTGAATTMPTGRFEYMGTVVPVYSERNGARMPAFHRLDFSATLTPKHAEHKKWKGEWVFSIYNVYNRHNPFTINFVQDENNPDLTVAEKTYLLPILPAVTYNFKFVSPKRKTVK